MAILLGTGFLGVMTSDLLSVMLDLELLVGRFSLARLERGSPALVGDGEEVFFACDEIVFDGQLFREG